MFCGGINEHNTVPSYRVVVLAR